MSDLPALLARLQASFPADAPLRLRDPAPWDPSLDARFPGGHVRRWFAACDGQEGAEPAVDAHALCSLAEARSVLHTIDALRAEPEGYWVEPHWLPITSDGAGQHLMIDDRTGAVLSVAHDDDHVDPLAPSPEAWLQDLCDGLESGALVWDSTFGITSAADLAAMEARRREREAQAPPAANRWVTALVFGGTAVAMGLLLWFLESNR